MHRVVLISKPEHSYRVVATTSYRRARSMWYFDLLIDPGSWLGKA